MPLGGTRKAGRKGRTARAARPKKTTAVKVTKTVNVTPMKDTAKAQVTTLVKGLISRSEETKYKGVTLWNTAPFNGRISPADWTICLPQVAQVGGSGNSFTRIGDRIKPKGLYIDALFAINHTEANSLGMAIDMFVVKHKSKKSWNAFNAGSGVGAVELSSYLLDNGAGAKFGYDGSTEHALMPVNTDLVSVIKHKRYNLYSSYAAATNQRPSDDSRRYVRVGMKIPTPSTLIYDSAIDPLNPTNFCPLVAFGFHYPDGTTNVDEQTPLLVTMRARLYFDDA